jgi:hypothetical protein
MRAKPIAIDRVERLVVGFFLHERVWSDGKTRGCGDVAFWTTEHPKSQLQAVHEPDRALNGQLLALDFNTPEQALWVRCVSCGQYVHLHVKRYRAIPRPGDVVKLPGHIRAISLDGTLSLPE